MLERTGRPRLRPALLGVLLSFLASGLGSCGSGPHIVAESDSAYPDAGRFIDWDEVDWKYDRQSLAGAYLFQRIRPREAYRKYLDLISLRALDPLTPGQFAELSPVQRAENRSRAAQAHDEAMAFYRSLWRGWEVWTSSRTASVTDEMMSDEMGILIPAIGHLRRAAALDPGNPFYWYDLGYFTGVIGDRVRQRAAFESCLEALDSATVSGQAAAVGEELADLYLRLLLDLAWLSRDEGRFEDGLAFVAQAADRIGSDDRRTLETAREALLLKALLLVDVDEIHAARQLASDWHTWRVPVHPAPHAKAWTGVRKGGLEHIDSNFAQNWVWAMTFLKLGSRREALARLHELDYRTEFPVHLNHRFWQDMGYVMESFGERERSRLCYAFSLLYHPYFPYFPLDGVRGFNQVLDQTGSGQVYFLGCSHFFVGGSYYSYAANRVMAMELTDDPDERRRHAEAAVDALGVCIRRDMQPARALALRGRAHFRLGNLAEAAADLLEANEHLADADLPRAETLKLLAVIHFNRQDYRNARAWADRYLAESPQDDFGWLLAGMATAHLGGLDHAKIALDRARELNPDSRSAWYNLALILLQQGDSRGARELLDDSLQRFPDDEKILRLQQLVVEQPESRYRMVAGPAELVITEPESQWTQWSVSPSDVDLSAGVSARRAVEMIPRLRRLYDEHPTARNRINLARILMRADRPAEVQDLLAGNWPDDLSRDEALVLLAADRATGQIRRAAALAYSLEHQPNSYPDSELWALVAVLCLENEAPDASALALRRALQLDPDNAALASMAASLPGR